MLGFPEISSDSVVRRLTTKAKVIFSPSAPEETPGDRGAGASWATSACCGVRSATWRAPSSQLIALGQWTQGGLAQSQAVLVSLSPLQSDLRQEMGVTLLQGPVASE